MTYDTIRHDARDQLDAEYESSTPGAARWRERTAAWRRERAQTAATGRSDDESGADGASTRLAQRHRFGRTLDKPPVRDDFDEGSWLGWLALYFAAVVTVLIVLWLVMS
jgi:hypothetical protein